MVKIALMSNLRVPPEIPSMTEHTEFPSPLDEGLADKMRSSDMFFKHLDNPNGKKESYFPLPKRFASRLEGFPKNVQLNVTECMRRLYRSGQDWLKEMSFHYLTEHGIDYPYKSLIGIGNTKLKDIYASYWLRDLLYIPEYGNRSLTFTIQSVYDSGLKTESNTSIRMITDILCDVGVDGHIKYSIIRVTAKEI